MIKQKKPQKGDIENDQLLPESNQNSQQIKRKNDSDNVQPQIPGYEDIIEESTGMKQKFFALIEESAWKAQNQDKIHYFSQFMFIFGGISMIIISSLRFTLVQTLSVHEAIIDFYYLFLGIVISLSQLKTS